MTEALAAGKEVLSYCSSCGHAVAHTIIFMKTATIPGRVECKSCKKTHAYKDPNAPVKKTRKKSAGRKRTPAVPLREIWEKELHATKVEAVKYSPKSEFTLESVIDHPKFGLGIVKNTFDGNKIEVMFQDEMKTLVHKI